MYLYLYECLFLIRFVSLSLFYGPFVLVLLCLGFIDYRLACLVMSGLVWSCLVMSGHVLSFLNHVIPCLSLLYGSLKIREDLINIPCNGIFAVFS